MDEQQVTNVQQTEETNITQQTSGATVNVNTAQIENTDNILNEVAGEGQQEQQQTSTETTQTPQGTNEAQTNLQKAQASLNSAEQDLISKGVDFKALEDEYQQTGKLSESSYNKLANAGYPKEVVDGVLNGWSLSADQFVTQVVQLAGGDAELARLQDYVRSQSDDIINSYNDAINSNDLGRIQLVFDGIKARMTKAYGTANKTILGNTGVNSGSAVGYESTQEMIKDMSDKRYQVDMAFTKEVYRKVKNAKFF